MLRALFLLTGIVLAAVAVAPAGIGHVAADRQQFFIEQLSGTIGGTELIADSVETGWLTSHMRHRAVLTGERLRAVAADLVGDPTPAPPLVIYVDTLVAHGPWPLLKGRPGLARMRSTLRVGTTEDAAVAIPGEAITDVGFLGGGRTRFVMTDMTQPLPGSRGVFRIADVDATLNYDRRLSRMRSRIAVGRVELVSPRGALEADEVQLAGETRRSGHGLWYGRSGIALDRLQVTDPLGAITALEALDATIRSNIEDGLLDHAVQLRIGNLTTPRASSASLSLETSVKRLDAAAVATLAERARAGPVDPLREDLVARLVRAGPTLEIRELHVAHGPGRMRASLRISAPDSLLAEVRNAADLVSVLEGEGRLVLDADLLEAMLAAPGRNEGAEGARALVAMGFLRPDGDRYVADLRMGGGLITVNGQPLPIRP